MLACSYDLLGKKNEMDEWVDRRIVKRSKELEDSIWADLSFVIAFIEWVGNFILVVTCPC